MKRGYFIGLLVVAAIAVLIESAGCSRKARRPTETELMVRQVLNETFTGNAEDWFAVEKAYGRLRLVELHGPTLGWRPEDVSETDRMNGITAKAEMWVNCRQVRRYDGHWSEWQQAAGSTGGVGRLLLSAMGPLTAQWSAHLQKKNGRWTISFGGAGAQYQRDHALLVGMLTRTPH